MGPPGPPGPPAEGGARARRDTSLSGFPPPLEMPSTQGEKGELVNLFKYEFTIYCMAQIVCFSLIWQCQIYMFVASGKVLLLLNCDNKGEKVYSIAIV